MSERIGKGIMAEWQAPHVPTFSCNLCGVRELASNGIAPVCGGTVTNMHTATSMVAEPPLVFEPVRCWVAAEPTDEGWEGMYLLYPVRSSVSVPAPADQVTLVEPTPAEKSIVTRQRNAEAKRLLDAIERQRAGTDECPEPSGRMGGPQ